MLVGVDADPVVEVDDRLEGDVGGAQESGELLDEPRAATVLDASDTGSRVERRLVQVDVDHRARAELGGIDLLQCVRSEEHTSELQSLMRISYAVFCLTNKKHIARRTSSS